MLAKIQKTLIFTSLFTMIAGVLLAIVAVIFKIPFTHDAEEGGGVTALVPFLLTFAVFALFGFFSNSALDIYDKKKPFSIVALSLLGLSSVLGLVNFWSFFKMPNLFGQITATVAVSSVFIVIMMTTNAKLCGKMQLLQFITYGIISLIDIVIIMSIFGFNIFEKLPWFTTPFVILCLIAFALLCTCSILAKRVEKDAEQGTIRIKKSEYDALLRENAELKAKLQELQGAKNQNIE